MKTLLITSTAIGFILLSSCAGVIEGTYRGPISGAVYDENGISVDQKTVANLVNKFTRLMSGESASSIILDPFAK